MSRNLVKPATLLNSKGDMIFKGNLKELKGNSVGYSSGGFQPMELRVAYE